MMTSFNFWGVNCPFKKFLSLVSAEVSYAQGMNDLCSRFLEVLDSEVDTYWSFSCYMEKFSKDFRADGLYRKMGGFPWFFQTV